MQLPLVPQNSFMHLFSTYAVAIPKTCKHTYAYKCVKLVQLPFNQTVTWWQQLCRKQAGRTDWRRKRQLGSVCARHSLPNKFQFSLRELLFPFRSLWQRQIITSLITEKPGAPATINVPLTRRPVCLEMYFQVHRGCRTVVNWCQQDYNSSVSRSCFPSLILCVHVYTRM